MAVMRAAAVALVALGLIPAGARAAPADEPTPVALAVGETRAVCGWLVACPILMASCDDPDVARVEAGKAGAELRGGAPGTTLCGIVASTGVRRLVRVTVKTRAQR